MEVRLAAVVVDIQLICVSIQLSNNIVTYGQDHLTLAMTMGVFKAYTRQIVLSIIWYNCLIMATIEDFEKIDMRLGRVVAAEDFPEARVPALKLTIDLGPEIGIKKSSAQLVGVHTPEELVGKLVVCVVNFPPRQVGPFMSEVLTLGFKNTEGEGSVVITPDKDVAPLGSRLC